MEDPRENATWMRTNHAQVAVGASKPLAANHEDWASEEMGEALYIRTLRILRWGEMIRSEAR